MTVPAYLITLPPPTPNGGLHMGHLTGPFLAADAFYKHQRLTGHRCLSLSYSDANQSYVRVTAEREGRQPDELARYHTAGILQTLSLYSIDADEYFYPNQESNGFVRDLILRMYREGALRRKAFPMFYSPKRGAFLDEAGVSGICPRCLAVCKCGICEACAYINNAASLACPRDTLTGDEDLEVRSLKVMVLETERYRGPLEAFYRGTATFRPRYRALMRDALSERLPDFPVTLPASWGIPMDHPDFPGQIVNPWAEVMAQFLWGYERVGVRIGPEPRVVNFFGFDNSYFYAVIHAALFIAAGRSEWLPHATINNEFYNLHHQKFSTSNNHVVWASDLADRFAPDVIRFYAAFNNPGFEKSNFSETDMERVVEKELFATWRAITANVSQLAVEAGLGASPDPGILRLGATAVSTIGHSYTAEGFHLRQAAEDLLHLLGFLRGRLSAGRLGAADAAYLIKCFAQSAYPLMPIMGSALYEAVAGRPLEHIDTGPSASLVNLPSDPFASHRTAAAGALRAERERPCRCSLS